MGKSTPWHYRVLWGIMADPALQAPSKCAATVLLLKYHNHKTGQCNPSYSTVAKLLGRDRRNVINAVNDLKAGDWIEWAGTKGGSSSNTNAFKFKMKGASGSDEVVTPNRPRAGWLENIGPHKIF
jgi:Helix-turn-helix domain